MRTDSLRVCMLSDEAFAWYLRYLEALDAKDLDAYSGFLASDVELVTNNGDPIIGLAQVRATLGPYWQSFGTLEHDLLNIYGSDDRFVLEALNHYTTWDGRPITLRAVAFTDRSPEGLVSSVRLFTDAAPLFA